MTVGTGAETLGAVWIAVSILALTASALTVLTFWAIRRDESPLYLAALLALTAVAIPALLVWVAGHLPPQTFEFLR